MTRTVRVAALAFVTAALAGCTVGSNPEAGRTSPPAASLTATLATPNSVKLAWKSPERDAAGRIVEYATEADGDYTTLEFLPPGRTTFTHANLMPDSTFYYRVRPFFGPASPALELTLPKGGPSNAEQNDDAWAMPLHASGPAVATRPIRTGAATAAAPTDLAATVVNGNAVKFTWTDHANDEEGYVLEVKPAGAADYTVAEVLDPDVNSVGLVTLPQEQTASFRVRPYYFGPASNVAHVTTGPESGK